MRNNLLVLAALSALTAHAGAQDATRLRSQVRDYVRTNDVAIVRELSEFLAIPNLASDSVNIRRNASHIVSMLERRGAAARLLEAPGSPPAVYGELRVPGAARTVVFYSHYDGQPVDTSRWSSAPWNPVLRDSAGRGVTLPERAGQVDGEWRLYARSASDDKSPIIAILRALDALKASGKKPSVNLKFFFEGEEEAGSPHLRDMLVRHRDLLAADLWIFGDGPVHQSRKPQVVFGARGVMGLEMTIYGPSRALHSGHYGNWAPNPLALMSSLLASMRNEDGRILIDDFYQDVRPPSPAEREAIAAAPSADAMLRRELQLGSTEAGNAPLMERIMMPALNVRGISGGSVQSLAANAVPVVAHASIDFRLVPHQTPARIRSLVEAHAKQRGYFVLNREPTADERRAHPRILRLDWEGGYPASRADMTSPAARALLRSAELGAGSPLIVVPTSGGSLPLYHFEEVLRTPLISLPIVNHDNNQHSANENVRLKNVFDGIVMFAGVLAYLGEAWNSAVP
jgi:acetylornithine deacetylase/succinyl-diaminopimelate desuccinylase-like protein